MRFTFLSALAATAAFAIATPVKRDDSDLGGSVLKGVVDLVKKLSDADKFNPLSLHECQGVVPEHDIVYVTRNLSTAGLMDTPAVPLPGHIYNFWTESMETQMAEMCGKTVTIWNPRLPGDEHTTSMTVMGVYDSAIGDTFNVPVWNVQGSKGQDPPNKIKGTWSMDRSAH